MIWSDKCYLYIVFETATSQPAILMTGSHIFVEARPSAHYRSKAISLYKIRIYGEIFTSFVFSVFSVVTILPLC